MSYNEHLWNQSQELVDLLNANSNFRQELLSNPKSALTAVGLPGGFKDSDLSQKHGGPYNGVSCGRDSCTGISCILTCSG